MLMGMDKLRADKAVYNIHDEATRKQAEGDYLSAEMIYRNALKLYPNNSGIILGLGGTLALLSKDEEAIFYIEKGLKSSDDEKQRATMRAILCFVYLRCGKSAEANALALSLPHTRESREVIVPLIGQGTDIYGNIKYLLLGI